MKWALHLYHQQRQGSGHGWPNLFLPLFVHFGREPAMYSVEELALK
jgi:hypothetical protein